MLGHFFQIGPVTSPEIIGSYDLKLVILSFVVATFASYIALDITGRLRDENVSGPEIIYWLLGGAFAMGAGIWSMHFIGMLSFKMPMPMNYSPVWTGISMLVAVCASFFALNLLKKQINWRHLAGGGIILGVAIASMHYTGMHAMNGITIHYRPGLFFLSIAIAIIASEAALWLALKSNEGILNTRIKLKIISAIIMGSAICGMHYTGMASAVFTDPSSNMPAHTLDPGMLSITIAGVTFFVLGIAFTLSTYKEMKNQQLIIIARLAGMTEVATNVLHNVGNVLNSVNISAAVIREKTEKTPLLILKDLNDLLARNKSDLPAFFSTRQGAHLPDFVSELFEVWKKEQQALISELNNMGKNLQHIKDIISTQQSLNYVTNCEQRIYLSSLIDEAILLTGAGCTQEIAISKNIQEISPVFADKIKLMQIIVNLLQNARESVQQAKKSEKKISVSVTLKDSVIQMVFTDNGTGIEKENMVTIFTYGFTTKRSGHGYGLHTSAILARQLGGTIRAESDGMGKGARFTLEIPNKQSASSG